MYKLRIAAEASETNVTDKDLEDACLAICGGGYTNDEVRKALDMKERLLKGETIGVTVDGVPTKLKIIEGLEEPDHSGL